MTFADIHDRANGRKQVASTLGTKPVGDLPKNPPFRKRRRTNWSESAIWGRWSHPLNRCNLKIVYAQSVASLQYLLSRG
jgi:hypothetical protein